MTHRLGFFDVDCRELNDAGDGLQFRPRVEPLAAELSLLYAAAERDGAPLVFTTCCSGRMLAPESLPEILFVPLDAADVRWTEAVAHHQMFYLQKNAYGDPKKNFACQAFDMFADNGNAAKLVRELDVAEWIVFGNGFDLCVNAAARGLLAAGQRVRLLTDVIVPSATGYGPTGTEENRRAVIAELARRGARTDTLAQALSRVRP